MTQAEVQARRADKQPSAAHVASALCVHRSARPVGKIKCSCSNAPAVYTCAHPWVISGYCCPTLPQQPADGPIVLTDGTRIVPADTRRAVFIPMPLRSDETPRPWDAVTCESCPHRTEPPQHVAAILALGISGDFDQETGHADVLHVVPRGGCELVETPGLRSVQVDATPDLGQHLQITGCRLLIVYGSAGSDKILQTILSGRPATKVWWIDPTSKTRIPGAFYGLHPDLATMIQDARRSAFGAAFQRIITPAIKALSPE